MTKVIRFSKAFLPTCVLSVALIISGIFCILTQGLNLGLDFKAGLIEEVKIATPAISLSYVGPATVSVDTTVDAISLVVSGVGAENVTKTFSFAEYKTLGELSKGFETVEGVKSVLSADGNLNSSEIFVNSQASTVLGSVPYIFLYTDKNKEAVTVENITEALKNIESASVKAVGSEDDRAFQIRVADEADDDVTSEYIQNNIANALAETFGKDNVAVVKADFIGSSFSSSLATQSIILVFATLLLIWIYATVRFKWDFALGAILAIIHDVLIMFTCIAWFKIEFNSTIIAAVLTIIGYSINDTVVVLDRVRENIKRLKVKKFTDILDISQTEILNRTIITTVTTLLAVISLFVFTSGTMKDFAFVLIIGMISGIYSTIYIAGSFISVTRKNWKPSDEEKQTQVIDATELV